MQSDITVLDSSGQTVLMVELKARTGTSKDWATMYRRNLAAQGFLPKVPFFLIATPDHFYLWKNAPSAAVAINPDYDVDATEVLDPYYRKSNLDPQIIIGAAFELIVAAWLADVREGGADNGAAQRRHRWLAKSGLLEALRGGRVVFQDTAT